MFAGAEVPMTTAMFDSHAAGYNAVAESALGQVLRDRVRSVVGDRLTPESTVADLGCGSGLDAAWLSPQVARVFAVDASAEMVKLAIARCQDLANTSVEQGDVASWTPPETTPAFDLVLANFGVVNCVGPLNSFADHLRSVLAPNGHAVLVTMARWCPIELAIGLAGRNRDLLRRRSTAGGRTDPAYADLDIRYASASNLAEAFVPHLELVHAEALGLVLPPFEQRRWVEDRPGLRRRLADLDRLMGPLGARLGIGDHHIAVFRAKP